MASRSAPQTATFIFSENWNTLRVAMQTATTLVKRAAPTTVQSEEGLCWSRAGQLSRPQRPRITDVDVGVHAKIWCGALENATNNPISLVRSIL